MIAALRRYFARRQIRNAFGSYLSPAQVTQMAQSGQTPELGAREIELTPLFINLQGYVGIAEQVSLARLPLLMNAYFDTCTAAVQDEGGTVDKYIGDEIVAMFGAPAMLPDHALRACVAALRCQAWVETFRGQLSRDPEPWPELARQFRLRIGLHTGIALVGNMGSRQRFNYTMMGDNVNVAARMNPLAKHYGVWTLCSGETRAACERAAPGRVIFRRLGQIPIKGRLGLLEIFEPAALRETAPARLHACIAAFEIALARWSQRDWAGAVAGFENSAQLECDQPGTSPGIKQNPSTVYLQLARSYLANPGTGPLFV